MAHLLIPSTILLNNIHVFIPNEITFRKTKLMNELYVYLRIYAPLTPLMNTLGCIGMTLQSTTEIISAT